VVAAGSSASEKEGSKKLDRKHPSCLPQTWLSFCGLIRCKKRKKKKRKEGNVL